MFTRQSAMATSSTSRAKTQKRKDEEKGEEEAELEETEDDESNAANEDGDDADADGDDDGDDEEEDSDDSMLEQKVLPDRETRGRRIQTLLGEAELQDTEFWTHDTWKEEQEDEEWSTEDESHYKDIVDSDFDDPDSEPEDESEITEEQQALNLEAKREKFNRHAPVYHDPRKMSKKVPIATKRYTRIRSSSSMMTEGSRPLPPAAAKPHTECERAGKLSEVPSTAKGRKGKAGRSDKRRILSQEDHLAIAIKTEQENTKRLNAMIEHENWKKAMREQKQSSARWNGGMELLISWSSERLIEYEEQQKAKRSAQLKQAAQSQEDPYCREMLFFVDFDNPVNSSIPTMYQKPSPTKSGQEKTCKIFPSEKARYRDPVTGEFYSNAKAFRELRRRYQSEWTSRLESRLKSLNTKLENIFHYVALHELVHFTTVSKTEDQEMSDALVLKEGEEEGQSRLEAQSETADRSDSGGSSLLLAATSVEELHLTPSETKETPLIVPPKEKRGRRPKRTADSTRLPPLKRHKPEQPVQLINQEVLGPAAPLATGSLTIERHSGKRVNRHNKVTEAGVIHSTDVVSADTSRSKPDAHYLQPMINYEHQPLHNPNLQSVAQEQQQNSAFAIQRQPLRIRSTSNAFYQHPAAGFPSPFTVPTQSFFCPDPRSMAAAAGLPYFAPGQHSGAMDSVTFFGLTGCAPYTDMGLSHFYGVESPVHSDPIGNSFSSMAVPVGSSHHATGTFSPDHRPSSLSIPSSSTPIPSSVYCYSSPHTQNAFFNPHVSQVEGSHQGSPATSGVPMLPHPSSGLFSTPAGFLPFHPPHGYPPSRLAPQSINQSR